MSKMNTLYFLLGHSWQTLVGVRRAGLWGALEELSGGSYPKFRPQGLQPTPPCPP